MHRVQVVRHGRVKILALGNPSGVEVFEEGLIRHEIRHTAQ